MAKRPTYNMNEIPESSHPAWQEQDNRCQFEEDIRLHLFDAMDRLETEQISVEEKDCWRKVMEALGELSLHYKRAGLPVKMH